MNTSPAQRSVVRPSDFTSCLLAPSFPQKHTWWPALEDHTPCLGLSCQNNPDFSKSLSRNLDFMVMMNVNMWALRGQEGGEAGNIFPYTSLLYSHTFSSILIYLCFTSIWLNRGLEFSLWHHLLFNLVWEMPVQGWMPWDVLVVHAISHWTLTSSLYLFSRYHTFSFSLPPDFHCWLT